MTGGTSAVLTMGIDHLKKYGKPRKPAVLGECFEVSDTPVGYVEFRDGKDNVVQVQYATLSVVTFNPSTELVLRFGKLKITLKGYNLRELVPLFSEHRVTLCKQSDDRGESRDDRLPYVSLIGFPISIEPDEKKKAAKVKSRRGGVANQDHLPGLTD